MTVILFLIVLGVLVLSHELGHFLAARRAGVRVDEFGFGFPPRLWGIKKGETIYSINAIPFGGFVKIHGETPDDESMAGADHERSLVNKPKSIQAMVLAAGVFFNLVLAWLLLSGGFALGLPAPAEARDEGVRLMIVNVLPKSAAAEAGLAAGDEVVSLRSGAELIENLTPEQLQAFVKAHTETPIEVGYRRGNVFEDETLTTERVTVTPDPLMGVATGLVKLESKSIPLALWSGAKLTGELTYLTVVGLVGFIKNAFTGAAALSDVTGPIGLAGLVGDASNLGFVYLLSLTAFISINLAVINLVPFPALDGGRLLFLLIEKIKGSPIRPKIANSLNLVGFVLLLSLMLVVTYHDLTKLF